MLYADTFIYKKECYTILLKEDSAVFKPQNYNIVPSGSQRRGWDWDFQFSLEDYQLMLDRIYVHSDGDYPPVNGVEPTSRNYDGDLECMEYEGISMPCDYTGGMVIGRDFVHGFGFHEDFPCFCYRDVLELIFENGKLVTTIDHQKAMVRIRKNLKRGLRDLKKGKDARCIHRFLKGALVGHYRDSFLKKSMKLAKKKVLGFIKRK